MNGFGVLPFAYFDQYLVESWVTHGTGHFPDYFQGEGNEDLAWGVPDFLGQTPSGGDLIHGREVHDGPSDERLGWAFALRRDQHLDIEELFVRPQYRRRGIGKRLVTVLLELREDVKLPLRLWVTFEDWFNNEAGVRRISDMLGLDLRPSPFRWACMLAQSSKEWMKSDGTNAIPAARMPAEYARRPAGVGAFAVRMPDDNDSSET